LVEEGYAPPVIRELAGGDRLFPHALDLVRADVVQHQQTMRRMSISGMQDKISLRLDRGQLLPVDRDGTHILKPVPHAALHLVDDVPANEAVTMQLARRLGVTTAAHALIRMRDGELAYITRRFDRLADGRKLLQEDLGVLIDASEATRGKDWKYAASYEEVGRAIGQHCSAATRDLAEYYRRVLFCFLIGNGDAHVRNFSILRDPVGRITLSPAYDLLCTQVHIPQGSDMAMSLREAEKGGVYSSGYEARGYYSQADFRGLAEAIGLAPPIARRITDELGAVAVRQTIAELVGRSFLSAPAQEAYLRAVEERRRKLMSD